MQFLTTVHEQAFLRVLAGHVDYVAPPARAAVEAAAEQWREGRLAGHGLLVPDPLDCDAWLAVVRLQLLARLSRLIPAGGPSLAQLHERGDATPFGWTDAVCEALRQATEPEVAHLARGVSVTCPDRVARFRDDEEPPNHPDDALACFVADDDARAEALERVTFLDGSGTIELTSLPRWDPEQTAAVRRDCRMMLSYHGDLGRETEWVQLTPDEARTCRALFAGLASVEPLALPPDAASYASRLLREAIKSVLSAKLDRKPSTAREGVAWTVRVLDRAHGVPSFDALPSAGWPAFAHVIGALYRFAAAAAAHADAGAHRLPGRRVQLFAGRAPLRPSARRAA